MIMILGMFTSYGQAGVGTFAPQPETLMDVYGTDKGLLIPRIFITDFETFNLPVGSQTESILLYNTNTTLGKGFTSWNGTRWTHVNNNFFWSTYGDNSISTSSFSGTTDNNAFILGTLGTSRLQFTTDARLLSTNNGTTTAPVWAFTSLNKGFYNAGDDLRISMDGVDYLSISNNNGILVNPDQSDVDFSIHGTNGTAIKVDSDLNRIAIAGNDMPLSTIHLQGSNNNLRVQSLDDSHPLNNGFDKSLLYVDHDGQLKLESTPHITQLPQIEFEGSFLGGSSYLFSDPALGQQTGLLHTTTQELFEDGLLEVVYQASVSVRNSTNGSITDGLPRKYGIRIKVNGRVVGQTAKMYTSNSIGGNIAAGFMYLNGKGYVPLTGSPSGTTYTIEVEAFVDGGGNSTNIVIGSSSNDFFEVIVHY